MIKTATQDLQGFIDRLDNLLLDFAAEGSLLRATSLMRLPPPFVLARCPSCRRVICTLYIHDRSTPQPD